MMYILDIGYSWGINLITKPYLYSSEEAARGAIDKLLPGVVWEYHNDYAIVDLHQFPGPVQFVDDHSVVDIFSIAIRPADDIDMPLPYAAVVTIT